MWHNFFYEGYIIERILKDFIQLRIITHNIEFGLWFCAWFRKGKEVLNMKFEEYRKYKIKEVGYTLFNENTVVLNLRTVAGKDFQPPLCVDIIYERCLASSELLPLTISKSSLKKSKWFLSCFQIPFEHFSNTKKTVNQNQFYCPCHKF